MDVNGLLFDIDGVLVVSWEPIPGAADTIARCRRAGLPMRFVTNTTSISRAEIARRLTVAGIPTSEDGPIECVQVPVVEIEQRWLFQAKSSQRGRLQQPLERTLVWDAKFGLDLQGACPP